MSKHKKSCIITILLCIIMASTSSVFADGGDGTGSGDGSGNGENKDIPLTLISSSVKNGDSNVTLNETIQLDFNKNICNVTVLSNNKLCFHLTDADGNAVAIKLIFPDNQVQREYRKQVFIQPAEDLKPETSYRIAVDNTVMAKNGTVIDNAHTISFTTGTHRTDEENKILKDLGDYIITYETASGENANSVPVNKDGLDDVSEESGPDMASIARIAAVVLIILIIAFTAAFIIIRRKKQ